MNNSIIGERIKELRAEYNLSQAKLGDVLMVSQDTISLWENNKALPNKGALSIVFPYDAFSI